MDKVQSPLTDEQLIEIQTRQLTEFVEYLRHCNSRVEDFGTFQLEEHAKETEMAPELLEMIRKALLEPEKPFTIKFKRKSVILLTK